MASLFQEIQEDKLDDFTLNQTLRKNFRVSRVGCGIDLYIDLIMFIHRMRRKS